MCRVMAKDQGIFKIKALQKNIIYTYIGFVWIGYPISLSPNKFFFIKGKFLVS